MPSLERLHQEFKGKPFVLIAIDLRESKDQVRSYVQRHGLSYTNLIDEKGDVAAKYGVSSTPVKFIIGPDGNLAAAAMGFREWDSDEVKILIQSLIKP